MKRFGSILRNGRLGRPTNRIVGASLARYSTMERGGGEGRILASIEGGLKSGPAEPMAEDAKGQAMTAIRRMALVLRVFLYGGVGVGLTAMLGFFGTHLWVEYLELPPPAISGSHDQYGWDDQMDGWGGAHLGKGTDPSLGWRIRAFIRAAWVAENWQAGQMAIDDSDQSSPHTSPDGHMVDSAYALSESRLQQAIVMAQKAGVNLSDRTLLELQLRLAQICERINTPLSLIKSYEIYSQLWKSCLDSAQNNEESSQWEARQAIRIADNLGQVGLKIAALERAVDASRAAQYRGTAENYLIWAITQALGIGSSSLDQPRSTGQLEPVKSSAWSAIFGSIDRRKTDASSSPCTNAADTIIRQLKMLNSSDLEVPPARLRMAISSLMNLSVHLVSEDIQKAFAVQKQIDEFVNRMASKADEGGSRDGKLHYHWLRSRAALSAVYLAEMGQAVRQMTDESIVESCHKALEIADASLATIQVDQAAGGRFRWGTPRAFAGRLSEPMALLTRDLRLTGAMGANFLGLKYESCPPKSPHLDARFKWCYHPRNPHLLTDGCQLAKHFFQRAVHYSRPDPSAPIHSHPAVLLNPLNENLRHLARIDPLSQPPST
ncbi:hypothetical protein VP01_63g7 [Puccinia sorghi]|uniref:Uncharacterized protein n=1 Tax=Puccinia sorghi TaxID=27349 RepID=A0A0L6UFX9_9BASI|nr:hypothetical protein VP01_63g7 [Puccinia sorghi]